MRDIADHVKGQAEVFDFNGLAVFEDVGHPKEAGARILPVLHEALEHGDKARPAQITGLSALQHQTRDDRYREIELFPIVPPAAHYI